LEEVGRSSGRQERRWGGRSHKQTGRSPEKRGRYG
jgi:hypothetical protein